METDIRDDLETKIIRSIFFKVKVCMSLLEIFFGGVMSIWERAPK